MCIYTHTYPCIPTYVQVNIFYTYIQIYIYIYIASQIVTDLGKEAVGWKLGKDSAEFMSRICLPSFPQAGEEWAGLLEFSLSCLLGFCIHIVSGLDPSEISLIMNSCPTIANSSLRSSHPRIQNSKGTKIKIPLQTAKPQLQPLPLDLPEVSYSERRVNFFFMYHDHD